MQYCCCPAAALLLPCYCPAAALLLPCYHGGAGDMHASLTDHLTTHSPLPPSLWSVKFRPSGHHPLSSPRPVKFLPPAQSPPTVPLAGQIPATRSPPTVLPSASQIPTARRLKRRPRQVQHQCRWQDGSLPSQMQRSSDAACGLRCPYS